MTSNATPASPRTRGVVRALVVVAVLVGVTWLTATPAMAGLGGPVDPRDTTEPEDEPTTTEAPNTTEGDVPTSTEADGPASTEAVSPATTEAGDDDAPETATVDEADDGGTSIAALGAVGVVAFVLGLAVAAIPLSLALSRRRAAGPAPVPGSPPAPTPAAPAGGGPAIGPAPSRESDQLRTQRGALADALIGLRDKVPSAALGEEAAHALAAAGITEVNPVGQPFDASHHHAVHQVATDDPARHGTVASVERPGYTDGSRLIRPPEVVVAVHGSGS